MFAANYSQILNWIQTSWHAQATPSGRGQLDSFPLSRKSQLQNCKVRFIQKPKLPGKIYSIAATSKLPGKNYSKGATSKLPDKIYSKVATSLIKIFYNLLQMAYIPVDSRHSDCANTLNSLSKVLIFKGEMVVCCCFKLPIDERAQVQVRYDYKYIWGKIVMQRKYIQYWWYFGKSQVSLHMVATEFHV